MKLNFELRKEKTNAKGLIPIQIVIRSEGIIIRKNAGVNTKDIYWAGARVKPNLKKEEDNNYQFVNDKLQQIESKVNDIFFHFRANKISFSKEVFLKYYDDNEKIKNKDVNFFESYEEFLVSGALTKVSNTIKAHRTIKGYLSDFEKSTGYKVNFNTIDNVFFEELMKYSFYTKEIKNNYFAKIIAILKTFLNWATEKGYNTSKDFEKFKATEHNIDIVYLTFDELMLLYNHDFGNTRLNHTKDFYCMGCFTGLRFSDLSKLNKANISSTHITISLQKTKTQNHIVALNDYSKAILAKYKDTIYQPLPKISAQKFNKYIKESCMIVGIDNPTTITSYIGTKKNQTTYPKYNLITSHTARKTNITLSILLGIDIPAIMKNANIKKNETMRAYADFRQEYVDEQMDKWNK
ncbi:phage integrase SAM-like domain-containing protein [Flavobacterium psychrophilum]|uniref:phage integrase SAM-like domain-containing protein n=1 Tax=Flavobacterium psychrophilum TaxID=96345 RepID=UPI002C08170B|nr:phage integrase SAM-like domain-containing protein [Flavobacterium psychrophilum]